VPAAVFRNVPQQLADSFGGKGALVLGLVGGQCPAHRVDGIAVDSQRGNGELEHAGHGALGFGRDGQSVFLRGRGQHVEDSRQWRTCFP